MLFKKIPGHGESGNKGRADEVVGNEQIEALVDEALTREQVRLFCMYELTHIF